ncbi:MAG: VCBS repeat-containing protein, partial [Oxalobacteraceae bacterium]
MVGGQPLRIHRRNHQKGIQPMKKTLLACCAMGALGSATAAEFEFDPYQTRTTGSTADSVAIGDVNGDGRDDVALATTFNFDAASDYQLLIYTQLADGSLSAPAKSSYSTSTSRSDVEIVDMNNDGLGDILVGHGGGITMYRGVPVGSPVAAPWANDLACEHLASVDIDRDGNQDVVCQSWSDGAMVYYGDGNGGIRQSQALPTGGNGYNDMKIGDITGDGMPDLVITSQQSVSVFVYPNVAGRYGSGLAYPMPAASWSPSAHAIGDFNGDGRNDLAVAVGGNRPSSGVWIYAQDTAGRLGTPVRMASYDIPEAMEAADFDGNGRSDLLVSHHGWGALGRYMQSAGGLLEEVLTAAPSNGWSNPLAVGDINDDGCIDAAFADYNSGLVTLLGRNCSLPIRR